MNKKPNDTESQPNVQAEPRLESTQPNESEAKTSQPLAPASCSALDDPSGSGYSAFIKELEWTIEYYEACAARCREIKSIAPKGKAFLYYRGIFNEATWRPQR